MFRARVNNAATDWQSQLPFIEFAINNSFTSAISLISFQIYYGSNPQTPVSISEAPQLSPNNIVKLIEKYQVQAMEKLLISKHRIAKQINKKRGDDQFKIG